MARKIVASVLICIAVGVALHQILVYGGWEWDEVLSISHHEGLATATAVLGVLFYLLLGLKRRRANDGSRNTKE